MRDDLRKGRVSLPHHVYLITTVTEGRQPLFTDIACARLAVGELRRLHDDNAVKSLAWVLMPDHLHWLLQLGDSLPLSECIRLFKGRSAHGINRHLSRTGSVWQRAFHDHALRREEDLQATARYIIENPVRAGLAHGIGDYPHWDAVWTMGL